MKHHKLFFILIIGFLSIQIYSCSKFCYCQVIVPEYYMKKGTDKRYIPKYNANLDESYKDTMNILLNQGFVIYGTSTFVLRYNDASEEIQSKAKTIGGYCVCN
jgi:hypothetical protein